MRGTVEKAKEVIKADSTSFLFSEKLSLPGIVYPYRRLVSARIIYNYTLYSFIMRTLLRSSRDHRRRSSCSVPSPETFNLASNFPSITSGVHPGCASAGPKPQPPPASSVRDKRGSCCRVTVNVATLPRQPSISPNDGNGRHQLKRAQSKNSDIKTGPLLATIAVICMLIVAVLCLGYAVRNTWFKDRPPHLQ